MSDPLKQLKAQLKAVNEEIQGLVIEVEDPSTHPSYSARPDETVASLRIPNKLFLLWDKKISLQRKIGATVSSLLDMANARIKDYTAVVIKSSAESFAARLDTNSQR